MADIYVVDTSSLIDLEDRYPRSEHPKVWERLDLLIDEGLLKAPRAVYEEISPSNVPLHSWAKEKARRRGRVAPHTSDVAHLFLPDDILVDMAGRIAAEHRLLVNRNKEDTSADPYVIALARAINDDLSDDVAVIVTEEKNKPNKIPYVASSYGVRSIDILGLLKEIGL